MTADKDPELSEESSATFEDDREIPEAAEVSDAEAAEGAHDSAESDGAAAAKEDGSRGKGFASLLKRQLVPLLLGITLVGSAALAAVVYFLLYQPDRQTDRAAAEAAVQAASEGTVALLSYGPDTLDQDFTEAKARLTGDFLSYYTEFTDTVVRPAAEQKKVNTNAKVVQGAVSDLQPESASVLLFINQTTTSQDLPDGLFAVSSVKVGMTKSDGKWLISSFDPV